MYGGSTVDWGSVYGPAGGQAVATRASESPAGLAGMAGMPLPFGMAALVALGALAWWALAKWD